MTLLYDRLFREHPEWRWLVGVGEKPAPRPRPAPETRKPTGPVEICQVPAEHGAAAGAPFACTVAEHHATPDGLRDGSLSDDPAVD